MRIAKVFFRSLWRRSDEDAITRELRDAADALWRNVIQRSPIASYAVREQAERDLDKVLERVRVAVTDYDIIKGHRS